MQRSVVLGAMVLAATAAGCTNNKNKPAIDALEGLRGALESNGDTTRFGDSKVLAEAAIFARSEGLSARMLVLSQGALDVMLRDIAPRIEPRTYWSRARVYLRPGSCAKIEDVPLPPEARTSQPDSGWQASVRAKHTSVTTRLTNAFAADFRCGDGPRFTAIFTRAEPVDGTIRVANIAASTRGR